MLEEEEEVKKNVHRFVQFFSSSIWVNVALLLQRFWLKICQIKTTRNGLTGRMKDLRELNVVIVPYGGTVLGSS